MKHIKLTQDTGSKPVFVMIGQVTAVRATSDTADEGMSDVLLTGGGKVRVMESPDEVMKRIEANS